MAAGFDITSERAGKVMLSGLTDELRTKLREHFRTAMDAEIELAVDAAMETFKVTIEGEWSARLGHPVVTVLLEKKNG